MVDITDSQCFGIFAPAPKDRLIKSQSHTPYAFLIYGLFKENYCFLIKQKIWCSNDITFCITTTKLTPPDLLFSIMELSSLDTKRVHDMVFIIWSHKASISAIQDIIIAFPHNDLTSISDFKSFLATLKVGGPVPWWLILYNSDDWCWLIIMTDKRFIWYDDSWTTYQAVQTVCI